MLAPLRPLSVLGPKVRFALSLMLAVCSIPAAGSSASAAPQARSVTAPPGRDQGALAVELGSDGLWLRVCPEQSCSARGGRKLQVPENALSAPAALARLDVIELAPGRRLVHVKLPLAGGEHWEALVAAAVGSLEPRVIFSGATGALSGEEGEREGDVIWVREDDNKGVRVLVGRTREDVQLCGRPTVLAPRLLGADLELRYAKVQQLSMDERRSARVLSAVRAPAGPTPGDNALRAVAASSAIGHPQFLTDGSATTSWAEARGGDGRGEFIVLRPVSAGNIVSLELLARAEGEAAKAAAAPRAFWLLTRTTAFRVDWAEDAWQAPGVWYRVQLPEPVQEDCVAVVLEQGHTDSDETQVTLAELRGVTELQNVDIAQLVGRLSTPGPDGNEAVPALRQAGSAGAAAVIGAFSALDAVGRERALEVIEDAPCELTASVFVELVQSGSDGVRRRAERRLRACGEAAHPALRAAFEVATGKAGPTIADAISRVAPALAVELLGVRLAAAAGEQRAAYRDALGRAARDPGSHAALRKLLDNGALGLRAQTEVLRALGELLPRFEPEASRAFVRAAGEAATFDQRFLLLAPAVHLAAGNAAALQFTMVALRDPDPHLRATAARAAPGLPEVQAPLIAATRDVGVRVREGSALRLGELGAATATAALVERLHDDRWPRVRSAAARSLARVGPSAAVDDALVAALADVAPSVRAVALRALGSRGARASLPAIIERFHDTEEDVTVRAAAARALADLCDASQLDDLTRAAAKLVDRPSLDDIALGSAAVFALGRLAPPDLEQRLAPLARAEPTPMVQRWLALARQSRERCSKQPHPSGRSR